MTNYTVYVPVYHSIKTDGLVVREICAGLEEEGIPYKCMYAEVGKIDYTALQVSIVVDEKNQISIFYASLPGNPYLKAEGIEGRKAGQNAARLTKGQPLFAKEDL